MVYKYEDEIKEELEFVRLEFIGNQNEMLKELHEVYSKAKAYDKLVEFYPQKDEIPSDEFFMIMGYIIKVDYGDYTLEDIEAIVNGYEEDE